MANYLEIVKSIFAEGVKFGGDAAIASQGQSGLGVDWSQGAFPFKGANIGWNLLSYTKPLGGALYEFDADGSIRRADGNASDPFVDEYNAARRKMKESDWRAVEEAMKSALPSNEYLPFLEPIPILNTGVNICYRDAKNWRAPVDPLRLSTSAGSTPFGRRNGPRSSCRGRSLLLRRVS